MAASAGAMPEKKKPILKRKRIPYQCEHSFMHARKQFLVGLYEMEITHAEARSSRS